MLLRNTVKSTWINALSQHSSFVRNQKSLFSFKRMQTENTTEKQLTIFSGSCRGQTAAAVAAEPLLFLVGARRKKPSALCHCISIQQTSSARCLTHTPPPYREPISRILFELIASFAPYPYSASCEMILSSNLTRTCHPCCRWQALLYYSR